MCRSWTGAPLGTDPAWAVVSNTILVEKGMRVNDLRPASDISLPKENAPRRLSRTLSEKAPTTWMRRLASCATIYLARVKSE
jgi:hypothetical protein